MKHFGVIDQADDHITSTAKEWLQKPYARQLIPDEEGGYTATIQEFPGCFAEGETVETALTHLENTALSWIEAQLELGQPIPEPIERNDILMVRISRSLRKRVIGICYSQNISIDSFVRAIITSYVSQYKPARTPEPDD